MSSSRPSRLAKHRDTKQKVSQSKKHFAICLEANFNTFVLYYLTKERICWETTDYEDDNLWNEDMGKS